MWGAIAAVCEGASACSDVAALAEVDCVLSPAGESVSLFIGFGLGEQSDALVGELALASASTLGVFASSDAFTVEFDLQPFVYKICYFCYLDIISAN